MSLPIRQGWTERIRYQLKKDGSTFDISGMTVELVGETLTGTAKTFNGTVGIDTAATSIVYLDPTVSDLVEDESPLFVRWKVTDGSGKIAYFPRAEPLEWVVQVP